MKIKKAKRLGSWYQRTRSMVTAGMCLRFTENKALELEISYNTKFINWFRVCTQLTRKVSQPGFCLSVNIIGARLTFQIFDRRQWDYKKGRLADIPNPEEHVEFKYF